jgi:predicted RNA methylase
MKVTGDVLKVLSAAQAEGNALKIVGQLDRKLYEQTNKVLEAAGGKWNRKVKAHLFDGDATEAIEQVLLTGEIATYQDFDFFQTPPHVAYRLMDLAEIKDGMDVLEPSAGTGRLINYLPASVKVMAVELRDKYASQINREPNVTVLIADFMRVDPMSPGFDRVVMNPPFSKQQDIRHVLHALKFLKPGGRLVSVMSSGVTFRQNKLTVDFRCMVEERGGMIEENQEDAFKESGTLVRTVNVMIPN